jgi:kinesin family protein 5
MPAAAEDERVRVFARIRPPQASTLTAAATTKRDDRRVTVSNPTAAISSRREFRVDKVFDATATNEDVYLGVGAPILDAVLAGCHGSILAYGQSGSGKTYSMLNDDGDVATAGIVPRAAVDLFKRVRFDQAYVYDIAISMVQIYNETAIDLLTNSGASLKATQRKDGAGGFEVADCEWRHCRDAVDLLGNFRRGRTNLIYAETKMNRHSSRSHCVLLVRVNRVSRAASSSTDDSTGCKLYTQLQGLLTIVDMAGSERAKKSQSQGVRFNEATHINGSLLTFGNVVHALAEKQMHVPFRDSMLTKLLESSLSGRSRTALIVCVAPETEHAHESITSLELAARCMRVESRPIVYSADVEVDPSVFIRGLEEASGTTALHRLNETHQLLSRCAQSERAATDAEKARLNELLNKEMQARVVAEESLRAVEKSLQAVEESLRLEQVKVTKMEEEHHEALSRVRTSEDHASKKRNDELRELILRERADHAAEEARLREVNKHEEQKHAAETASLHEAKKSAEARVHETIERERTERATMEIKYRELVDRAKTERTIEKAQCVRTLRENLVREKSECAATVKRLSELLQKQEAEFAMESNELREHISNERAEHAASENALKSKVDNLESSLASALAELAGERDVCCKLQNELAHAVESATKAENRAIMQGVAIDALQLEITTEREAAQSATRNAAKELDEERANTRALEVKIVAERAERDTERAKIIADHARRVSSLEAEASAAKSENEKHAAVRDAMRQELHILRSTWRNDLASIQRETAVVALEAERAAHLKLAAGVALTKLGRNGKLYSRMVKYDDVNDELIWFPLGPARRMSIAGAYLKFAPDASSFVIKGKERDFSVEVNGDTAVKLWGRTLHNRLSAGRQRRKTAGKHHPTFKEFHSLNLNGNKSSPLPVDLFAPSSPASAAAAAAQKAKDATERECLVVTPAAFARTTSSKDDVSRSLFNEMVDDKGDVLVVDAESNF